jgi:hypothetical protein
LIYAAPWQLPRLTPYEVAKEVRLTSSQNNAAPLALKISKFMLPTRRSTQGVVCHRDILAS